MIEDKRVIKQVELSTVIPVRQVFLRKWQTKKDCWFPEDKLSSNTHFARIIDGKAVGVVSIYAQDKHLGNSKDYWRIRGVAVLPKYRDQGIGLSLVNYVLDYLKSKPAKMVWCNARKEAYPFYSKLGFAIEGDEFEFSNVGPHYFMKKML